MKNYTIKRLLSVIPVLFVVSLVVFYITYLIPGNPALVILGDDASPEEIRELEIRMGLDLPVYVQYGRWIKSMLTLDLGNSNISGLPVTTQIAEAMGPTISLTFFSTLVSTIIAIPLGILAARKKGSLTEHTVSVISMLAHSVPSFMLALGLMLIFSVKFRIFPVAGYKPLSVGLGAHIKTILLPSLSLGFMHAGTMMRMSRSSMLEVLGSDYIRLARAKGLPEVTVILEHAFKNTLVTMVTVIGQSIIGCLSGAAVVETVFGIPGIGSLVVTSIGRRDYAVIQGVVLLVSFINVVINLLIDLSYRFVDPRIHVAQS